MRYFATAHGQREVQEAMSADALGCIATPRKTIHPTAALVVDNGCFGAGYMGDDYWWAWLSALAATDAHRVALATAPDVVGDHAATLTRSRPWLPRIRALGLPAALVAQDGATPDTLPWGEFDALFIGGTTDWKLGAEARACVAAAKARGLHVHMGRVNTERRMRYAYSIGCDSVDGTFLAYGPEVNLPRLLRFMASATQPVLEM